MLRLDALSKRVRDYSSGKIDLDAFERWFRHTSWGSYDHAGDSVSDAIASVDAAILSFDLEDIDESELREQLMDIIDVPSDLTASAERPVVLVYGKPPAHTTTSNRWHRSRLEAVA